MLLEPGRAVYSIAYSANPLLLLRAKGFSTVCEISSTSTCRLDISCAPQTFCRVALGQEERNQFSLLKQDLGFKLSGFTSRDFEGVGCAPNTLKTSPLCC